MTRIFACAALLLSSLAWAASPQSSKLLPRAFADWKQSVPEASAVPDPANAAVLREYGLKRAATTTYASGARRLTVRAWRFADATGAFGAFTFLRQPSMKAVDVGQGGAVAGDHYLVWTGATVVDAGFTAAASNENAVLTALAATIPQPPGPESIPPSLPRYLPPEGLDAASIRYAIGPAAYERMGGVLPSNALGFSQDAEVVSAQYGLQGLRDTLTLVMYPTPQIAAAHLKIIDQIAQSSGMIARRIGPLVAVVSGSPPAARAQQLLKQIRFNDYVTMDRPEGYISEAAKLSRLLLGIATLTGILLGAALLLGFFLGGGRALVRLLRGKPISSVSEEEFISLHLRG